MNRSSSSFLKLENSSSLGSGEGQVPEMDENEKDLVLMLPASSGPSESSPRGLLPSSLLFGLVSYIGSRFA